MSLHRAARKITLLAASALLVAAPGAIAATSSLRGKIRPDRGRPGTPLKLSLGFTIDPEDREVPATLKKAVLLFPRNAVHNGRLFRSCSAAFINQQRGYKKCPKGSQIGRGRGTSDVPAAGVYNVPVRFTLFNGPRGKSIVVHVRALNPVDINQAFESPLVRTRGKFGYRLTVPVPESLQDIQPGSDWYVGLRSFNSTVGITTKVKGKKRGFIEAKTCPKARRVPIQATFEFVRDHSRTRSNSFIRCRR